MSYSAEISRSHPTALVVLLDQSSSMSDPFAGGGESKSVVAARVLNRLLTELTMKCAKADGIRDYYQVAVLGYGLGVSSAFSGELGGVDLQPISAIGNNPTRLDQVTQKVQDGAGGLVEEVIEMPVWIDAYANGMTPMCEALERARTLLDQWTTEHPESYPPTVLNITDGEANDGDPVPFAAELRGLTTADGPVLLFNCHLSTKHASQALFPSDPGGLVDEFAKMLFEMSSELPSAQLEAAHAEGFAVSPGSRGFIYNAGAEDLIRFVDIGSRASLR